ncbi:ABC transporter permease [Oscillatoria sp. CS-180]|uniref:ABC transporter permease n=1 Tax=Oscillatoria sp. CS-180 TaxID=3021720 RepID=UPI0023310D2B|nr:ABC transporter permease [Oscillatoria sp. CS-180]MDB9529664.1 ABC transporter permease [Oscillatoria sp. CS-180]
MLGDMFSYIIEQSQVFTTALGQHLMITFVALIISIVLGLVLGIMGSRLPWLREILLTVSKIGRTIPSLAILALALPLLGIGTPPVLLALGFIGTLPVLINTTVGIEQVDANTKEAARGMGMRDRDILLRLELPIAVPIIMAGIRTSAVVVVASATLAAFIGGGGLGDLILRGHALNRDHIMLAGALPATLLAFYFEEAFGRLERWATPKGLKEETRAAIGLMAVLLAVAIMPLIFGVLLPWDISVDAAGTPTVLTGLHSEYRAIGLPVLLLSLLAAMLPRPRRWAFAMTLITSVLAIASLIWLAIGIITQVGQFRIGVVLITASVLAIALITGYEFILSYRARQANPTQLKATSSPPVASQIKG